MQEAGDQSAMERFAGSKRKLQAAADIEKFRRGLVIKPCVDSERGITWIELYIFQDVWIYEADARCERSCHEERHGQTADRLLQEAVSQSRQEAHLRWRREKSFRAVEP